MSVTIFLVKYMNFGEYYLIKLPTASDKSNWKPVLHLMEWERAMKEILI